MYSKAALRNWSPASSIQATLSVTAAASRARSLAGDPQTLHAQPSVQYMCSGEGLHSLSNNQNRQLIFRLWKATSGELIKLCGSKNPLLGLNYVLTHILASFSFVSSSQLVVAWRLSVNLPYLTSHVLYCVHISMLTLKRYTVSPLKVSYCHALKVGIDAWSNS